MMLKQPLHSTPGLSVPLYRSFLDEVRKLLPTTNSLTPDEKAEVRLFIAKRIDFIGQVPFGSQYSTCEALTCHVQYLRAWAKEIDLTPSALVNESIGGQSPKLSNAVKLLSSVIKEHNLFDKAAMISGELVRFSDSIEESSAKHPAFSEIYPRK